MKLDRLLEITILLINRGTITAPELAERFGVSTRTIYRDIDVLSTAGVPVFMTRGAKGGISLMEGYTLPKSIVSREERDSILFSLQTLRSTRYPEIDRVLEKLSSLFQTASNEWIHIDFSPWESGPGKDKIRDLRDAILNNRVLLIDYVNADNRRSQRELEPCKLVYKARSWYLWAWCRERRDYRTFRLSRIREMTPTGERFSPSDSRPPASLPKVSQEKPMIHLVLKCSQCAACRLYDDYDETFITDNGDGTFTLEIDFPEDEWVYGYILGFGDYAEVLEPPHLRNILMERIERMKKIYRPRDKT